MRDGIPEIHRAGAELVIVGNGGPSFAAAFREDFGLDGPLLVDPELRGYRAAGLRRGRVEALSPKLARSAARALRAGHRQTGVEGDAWQLGGAFVIRPDGSLRFRHVADHAGDHARLDAILAALAPDAPAIEESTRPSLLQKKAGELLGRVLDPTIVLSFDRNGFRTHALTFDPEDLDVDLHGRRCLITGANSGIGYETSLALADLGAEVVMLCRSELRGEEAAERIRTQTGNRRVSVARLDVSDLASVRVTADALARDGVDMLIHNAGVLPEQRQLTRDGLELCFATHVVGPHLLTRLLAPRLAESPSGRVVWVSSGGMYTQRLDLHDLDWSERAYDGVRAYAQTKRMQVVMAGSWAMELAGGAVSVNAMHPGWADTPSVRISLPGFHRLTRAILRTPSEGADSVIWLAASDAAGALTGKFIFDRSPRSSHYLPFTAERPGDPERLWQLCERLTARPSGDD